MIECLTQGLLSSHWNIYHSTTAYFFWATLYDNEHSADLQINVLSSVMLLSAGRMSANADCWLRWVWVSAIAKCHSPKPKHRMIELVHIRNTDTQGWTIGYYRHSLSKSCASCMHMTLTSYTCTAYTPKPCVVFSFYFVVTFIGLHHAPTIHTTYIVEKQTAKWNLYEQDKPCFLCQK